MSGGMRGRAIVVGVAVALFALAGCSGVTPEPEEPAGAASEEGGPSDEQTDPVADCLMGTWQLDTADYLTQSTAYLQGLEIPLDSLDVEGGQQLVFAEDDYLTQSTDLTWTASLMGYTLTVPSQSVGEGTWIVEDGSLSISGWNWVVDPADAPPPSGLPAGAEVPDLPTFTLEGLVVDDFVCGDTITLQGPEAPLRGVFVRMP